MTTTDDLFEQLKHPNPHLREQAMWDLVEVQEETLDSSILPRLMAILDDEDTNYRRAAVKALGAIGPLAVPSLVAAMLQSDNVTVRGSCAKALAQVAINYPEEPFPEEGKVGLKAAIQDANPVVHIAAVMALGEVGVPAFEILQEALETTENPAVAVAIVNAIGSIPDPRSEGLLKGVIENPETDDYVRESAVSSLSRLDQVRFFNRQR